MASKSERSRLNRQKDLRDYKNKWGLMNYKFALYRNWRTAGVVIINNYIDIPVKYVESHNLQTILRWLNVGKIDVWENYGNQFTIDSIKEFKRYFLTKKLSGIG